MDTRHCEARVKDAAATHCCRAAVEVFYGPVAKEQVPAYWRRLHRLMADYGIPFKVSARLYHEWLDGKKAEAKLSRTCNPWKEALKIHHEMVRTANAMEYHATTFMG